MALQKVGARALAVGAGAAKLHGGVLLAAVLAHGHGGMVSTVGTAPGKSSDFAAAHFQQSCR